MPWKLNEDSSSLNEDQERQNKYVRNLRLHSCILIIIGVLAGISIGVCKYANLLFFAHLLSVFPRIRTIYAKTFRFA